MSITSPDPAIRKNTLDFAGYLVEFAHRLGVKVLVFGSPAQRDIDPSWQHSGAFKRGVDFLAGMARACEERGLVIGFEPLGPSITNFGATVEDAIEIVEIVGSPALQLHLDVKALLLEKIPPAELIMLANRRIVHFHANDANRLGPGMGAVDHVPILKALASVGYSGWLSVETFGNAVPPDEIAARSITYLRHVMAGIA